jgi:hypothetical protein
VIESHWRASRDHVLDSREERDRLRGELTYFYCTGEPIVAETDRRALWKKFAPAGLRLLPLPGLHAWTGGGPQYAVLPTLLRAGLNGASLRQSDHVAVFDRTYRIGGRAGRQRILGSTGEEYLVDEHSVQGYVDTFTTDGETVRFGGWAVEHCLRQPAQTIAVFLGDRFLGHGASSTSRLDIAQQLSAPSAKYAGFELTFWRSAIVGAVERPRLFVLSSDGCAAELRFNAVAEVLALRQETLAQRQEASALRAELGRLARVSAATEALLSEMENSTCWRFTRPLREIHGLVMRLSRGFSRS